MKASRQEMFFYTNVIRAKMGEMTYYLQGPLYGWHKQQTHEIKQAKGFKRYTCHVVKKMSYCQY